VTTENSAPTDDSFYTTSIPTATNAGTYYVWYKVKGDVLHKDSEAVSVKVTVSEKKTSATAGSSMTAKEAEKTITGMKTDKDPAGSDSAYLLHVPKESFIGKSAYKQQ